MIEANKFVEKYVAIWNESDESIRRKAIAELWARDGNYFAEGIEAKDIVRSREESLMPMMSLLEKGAIYSFVQISLKHFKMLSCIAGICFRPKVERSLQVGSFF